ncbi:MAG TPA: hypothetical protein GX517_01445 [Alicyclobacillus sp.]|nr:hypothetical protein [Alicyclobacillus sp.]
MTFTGKFQALNPFHRWLIVISAALLVTFGVLGYISFSATREARTAAARLKDAQDQMQVLQQKVARPVPVPDLSLPAREIPTNWDMARFFADLTNAAKTWGVHITSVTPNPPTPDPGGFQPSGNNGSGSASVPSTSGNTANRPVSTPNGNTQPSGMPATPSGSTAGNTTGSATKGTTSGNASGQAAPAEENAGATKGKEGNPPAALPGVHSLTLAVDAEGTGSNLLAFLNELTAMPRLVWITEYTLDFGQGGTRSGGGAVGAGSGPARLQLTLTLYSHAPWDSRAVAETPWPFPIQPAGNPEAFGP